MLAQAAERTWKVFLLHRSSSSSWVLSWGPGDWSLPAEEYHSWHKVPVAGPALPGGEVRGALLQGVLPKNLNIFRARKTEVLGGSAGRHL